MDLVALIPDLVKIEPVFDERRREWTFEVFMDGQGPVPSTLLSDGTLRVISDRAVWGRLSGSALDRLPDRSRDVEKVPDPKKALADVAPRRGKPIRDYFDFIARNIDLAVLAQVPAYADWVADSRNALKGLGYL